MQGHYTWFSWVSPIIHSNKALFDATEKLILGVALGAVIILIGRAAAKRIKNNSANTLVVPDEKVTLTGIFDLAFDVFTKYQDSVLGRENRQYLPLTFSIFSFILLANLLGLIPGMAAITTTIWVNVGMALVVFIAFNYYGIRENGVINYLKHFCGPIWILAPFIFCLEVFSTSLRVVTLNLRLYWNITADHMVLGTFTEMTKVGIPVIFYGLGTFVCFMQAFIFTTLTMVYILLATQHEEAH